MKATAVLVVQVLTTAVTPALATDWDSCASDLDDLRRAASDAYDAAEETSSQQDEMEDCDESDDFSDCGSERDEFESAANDAESELDTVLLRFRSVTSSCGLPLVNRENFERYVEVINNYEDFFAATSHSLFQGFSDRVPAF